MKLFSLQPLALSLVIAVSGCALHTGPNPYPAATPERVAAVVRLAAWTSASAAILRDPGARAPLTQAAAAACSLKAAGTWDLAALHAALQTSGLATLAGEEGHLAIDGLWLLLDASGQNVDLNSGPYAAPVIFGICDGLSLATSYGAPADTGARLRAEARATRP